LESSDFLETFLSFLCKWFKTYNQKKKTVLSAFFGGLYFKINISFVTTSKSLQQQRQTCQNVNILTNKKKENVKNVTMRK